MRINILFYMSYTVFASLLFWKILFLTSNPSLLFSLSIILSTFVLLTHSNSVTPPYVSHLSLHLPLLSLPDAYDSHSKCLYLLLFLHFLPPSHSNLILPVSSSQLSAQLLPFLHSFRSPPRCPSLFLPLFSASSCAS